MKNGSDLSTLTILCGMINEKLMSLENDCTNNEREKATIDKERVAEREDILSINAGGQLFMVKRSTLLMGPNESVFNAMFSGRWDESLTRDKQDHMFLNISSQVFAAILSHLRAMEFQDPINRNHIKVIPVEKVFEAELEAVCHYYGLISYNSPLERIDLQVKAQDSSVSIVEEEDGFNLCVVSGCITHRPITGVKNLENGAVWKITVVNATHWMYAGIMAKEVSARNSQKDPSSFGWASRQGAYIGGLKNIGHDGWNGWETGDVSVFKLDTEGKTLKMYHSRSNKTFSLPLNEKNKWRLHFNFIHKTISMRLSNATPDDVALIDS